MRLRVLSADGKATERAFDSAAIRLGRDPRCDVAFDAAEYPSVSAIHARIDRTAKGLTLTHLSQSNKTLLNDEPVEGLVTLKPGDRIRLGFSGPTIEVVSLDTAPRDAAPRETAPRETAPRDPAPRLAPTVPEEAVETMQPGAEHLALLRGSLGTRRLEIGNGGVIGRERGSPFLLDHPLVSRRHARLRVDRREVTLQDLDSANGTYVNGKPIQGTVVLRTGDRIDIGPFALRFEGDALVSRSRSNNIELAARRVRRVVQDRATGKPLTLLHDISLVIRPREFVCLLGPSGSGKSTLLTILSGRNRPSKGNILVNGEDLYENFAAVKQDIAVVPQKEALHDALAVGTALHYTAELRLPPDTSGEEIDTSVGDLLDVVGLTKRRGTLIRHLSGGQLKRASLANELMARPSLLFLDEVTSGLDEQTDREMMELFRQVADSGKTVVCITHSLANVEATCHLVVILTEGGYLAFIGTPDEARTYFAIPRLGDVYRKLAEKPAEQWQTAFKESPFYARYVRERMTSEDGEPEEKGSLQQEKTGSSVQALRQAWVLTRRYAAIWRGDPMALLTMLGQSFLVAILLGTIFGVLSDLTNTAERIQRTINLLFLMNVAAFWFGCNNSAKELVKDRIIYTRERNFNLRIDCYYLSKFVILTLIALVQVTLLFGIVRLWCDFPGSAVGQWFTLAVLAVAGTALGLLLSAGSRTEEVAVALVPLVVMPQIILASVIAPLKGLGLLIGRVAITAYWGQRALEALLPDADVKLLPEDPGSALAQLVVVVVHLGLFIGGTCLALYLADKRRASS